MKVQEFFL
jgi:hypothetical protein